MKTFALIPAHLSLCVPGEKPFLCTSDGCEKTFSSPYSLKSHIRGHDKGPGFTVSGSHPLSEVGASTSSPLSLAGRQDSSDAVALISHYRTPVIRCASVI